MTQRTTRRTQPERDRDLAEGRIEELRAIVRDLTVVLERRNNAIKWALGEISDPDGQWFGERRPEQTRGIRRPYWWRKNLRRIAFGDGEAKDDKNG